MAERACISAQRTGDAGGLKLWKKERRIKPHIILLRGLTPTGKNKVLMAPLRAALEDAGLRQVQTYIQSGNVLAATALNPRATEALVHRVIQDRLGADITVLVRPAAYFQTVMANNPFDGADPAKLYFTLLAREPEAAPLQAFCALELAPDQVQVVGDMAYVLCATKYSDLKANNNFIERKLKVAATTRNFNTMAKLIALSA